MRIRSLWPHTQVVCPCILVCSDFDRSFEHSLEVCECASECAHDLHQVDISGHLAGQLAKLVGQVDQGCALWLADAKQKDCVKQKQQRMEERSARVCR